MKLDERHLAQLAAVVHAGGVTEGAALLGLTQPAVSRTLSMLEKRVGEPLFLKGRRPLQPTQLGRSLADQGQLVLTAARRASEVVDRFRRGSVGTIRLGGTPTVMDALVSPMIASFHTPCPEVRVEQSYAYLPDLQVALKADQIDLAVCPIDLLAEGSGFQFHELLPSRSVIACRVTHPLLLKRRMKASDVLDYPWIAPPAESPLRADLRALLLSVGGREFRMPYSGGSLASAINYLKATDALTILPYSAVVALRGENTIAALPVPIPHPARAIGILRLAVAPHAPMVDRFVRHLEAEFGRLRQHS